MNEKWIIWQNSAERMQHKMLDELRKMLKDNPVCTHKEIDQLLSDIYIPKMPDIGE